MPKFTPLLVLGLALLGGSALATGPSFTSLDPLGTDTLSTANAISDDGTTVVGTSGTATAFRWTAAEGMVGMGTNLKTATGVSTDGSVIVGMTASTAQGYRWTSASTTPLVANDPRPLSVGVAGVSPDGNFVLGSRVIQVWVPPRPGTPPRWEQGHYVGGTPGQPGYWTPASGGFAWTASGATASTAGLSIVASSYDGSVLVGTSGHQAFRRRAGTTTYLQNLSGSTSGAVATDVSADGGIIVGQSYVPGSSPARAALWNAAGTVLDLGDLPGGADDARANAVSPDGTVAVGQGTAAEGKRAFIWMRRGGMKDLRDVLVANDLAGELVGWTLTNATDVTVDAIGDTIVTGVGTDPLGRQRAFVAAIPGTAVFTPLGDLPTGLFASAARALSADGRTVVGVSESTGGERAFVWTAATGMYDIGDGALETTGVSGDGSVIVGRANGAAFRWTTAGEVAFLGAGSVASAISADGAAVAGSAIDPGTGIQSTYRWTASTGGFLPSVYNGDWLLPSNATGLSADGSIAVGSTAQVDIPSLGIFVPACAYRRVVATGAVSYLTSGLGIGSTLLTSGTESEATAVSADGSVVVGYGQFGSGPEAFRWTASGLQRLGDLPGPGFASRALAVSADGTVVVGIGVGNGVNRAFVWDAAYGMRDLQSVLSAHGASSAMAGWTLTTASGIAKMTDGTLIVTGTGIDEQGRTQAYHAVLP